MGCDMHAHVEVKKDGVWHHYNAPWIQRHYALFAKMAGVRHYEGDGIEPISEPKGVPDDITIVTQLDLKSWGCDAHSHSYLTRDEIEQLSGWYDKLDQRETPGSFHRMAGVFGYIDGESIEHCGDGMFDDVRIVFWFDN